ncbi:helix-turn-helix transcriptional regulator [Streptomyces erythrochromogenes]|uniref:helix-turn-helix transcriptional regulator n=1 Tax=Streptomyces erythrochromogenes TaxID=285574 RepID=UPI0022597F21|nr:LuxR family transcriptional regulator [Streptomyces erythrochromogenes]MCX5589488.1 LuxR family transcriptional regulator [Streptomyces erythrochromogenes]
MIIRGRGAESALVHRLLEGARAGMSGVLVLRGDAGIGKTALLDHAVASASGLQVTRVAGVEAEQELGFAAVHRVLLPFLGARAGLPGPQRAALETAFGMVGGAAPDRFLVGLAALTLLAESARERPLLVVCDDAQWLDRESLDVLAFVGRRLHADGIVALFALRDDAAAPPTLTGLPELRLGRLPESDALALLMDHADGGIDQVVAERIIAEAAGNPLALRELAQGPHVVEAGFAEPPALGRRLEARFLRRVHDMPVLTRTVLLTAAADATGDRHLVRRAVRHRMGAGNDDIAEAFEQAEREELLTARPAPGASAFRHPLIRSAVYGGASRAERRSVHAALAAVTDAHAEPERHAWHAAAAADGPDEQVASALHGCAERARNTGGYLAQAAFLQRAADLTDDPVQRTARLLEACAAALMAGAPHRAEELLSRLPAPGPAIPVLGAHADRLGGLARLMLGGDGAVRLLLDAALVLSEHDPGAGRDTLLEAFDAAMVAPRSGPDAGALQVAGAALTAVACRTAPAPGADVCVPDLLLDGHARLVAVGHREAAPSLRAALAAMRLPGAEEGGAVRWSLLGMIAAVELWDIDALGECGRRYADAARGHGALRMLQISAHANATSEVFRGNLAGAEAHFAEFKDIADATGADPRFSHPTDVMLHAWRGDEPATLSAVAAQRELYPELPGGIQVQLARAALVVLGLGGRRYPQAQAAAQAVLDDPPPHCGGLSLPGLVEAAVRNGDQGVARRALELLAERATASGTPWASGLLARSRALVAPDSEAEGLFQEAAAHLAPTPLLTEKAHTDLLYGEWLRRQRRRHDARSLLRRAHGQFTSMGAAAFAERARLELRATGEQARKRGAGTERHLTPQEFRVARMAARGATNQEIATDLFISASTVEYHLGKVFRKLGVSSRRQLAASLPQE